MCDSITVTQTSNQDQGSIVQGAVQSKTVPGLKRQYIRNAETSQTSKSLNSVLEFQSLPGSPPHYCWNFKDHPHPAIPYIYFQEPLCNCCCPSGRQLDG